MIAKFCMCKNPINLQQTSIDKNMKRPFIATVLFGSLIFASCGGGNAEAEAAREKARQDSIAAAQAEQARLDSIAEVERIAAELEQARLDSIEAAQAAASKGGSRGGSKGNTGGSKGTTQETPKSNTNPIQDLKGGGSSNTDADKVGGLKGGGKSAEEQKKADEGAKQIRNLKGGGN
ncbi:MAG: hypothetical protein ACK4GL_12315 [Flavobacteriales bacterium]